VSSKSQRIERRNEGDELESHEPNLVGKVPGVRGRSRNGENLESGLRDFRDRLGSARRAKVRKGGICNRRVRRREAREEKKGRKSNLNDLEGKIGKMEGGRVAR